jgi:hypothetical protein
LAMKAVAIMIDIGHTTLWEGNIMGVHQLDIMPAYPRLARGLLIHAMKAESLHGDRQKWCHSMLSGMTFKIVSAGIVLPTSKHSYPRAQQYLRFSSQSALSSILLGGWGCLCSWKSHPGRWCLMSSNWQARELEFQQAQGLCSGEHWVG